MTPDFRFACRGLWGAKTFTGTAVVTLALGIAGTTVMFALIEGVLLRPLPVHEQDRVIVAWKEVPTSASAQYPFGDLEIEAIADGSQLLENAAGVTRNGVGESMIVDKGGVGSARVALVTGGFFEVLRADPVVGRRLTRADDEEGVEPVAVISSGLWHRRYGASRAVIGQRVTLGEQPFTIVGVMPRDLDYPRGAEVWMLTRSVPTTGPFGDAARREVNLIARLRPGVTLEQATAEMIAFNARRDAEAPAGARRDLLPVVRPLAEVVIGDVRKPMLALFGAVVLVLLIACANVSNLLLMRGEARRSELAVRAALGAGRGRLVRQVLAESLVLAALGGLAGFCLAWSSLQMLVSLIPDGLPRLDAVRMNGTVVLFSTAVVFAAALFAGTAPAIWSMRADVVTELRSGGRGLARSGTARGRRTLVTVQVALAMTVVAAAGLLIRSVLELQTADLGLATDRLVLLDLHVPHAKWTDRHRHAQFLDDVAAQLAALPAVSAATPVNVPPFSGRGWDVPQFTAEGQTTEQASANPSLNLESIHPNYFDTFGIPIVRGRAFSGADREGSVQVAIVSHDLAVRIWPAGDAVGKRLTMGRADSRSTWYTVIGVATQTRYREVTGPRPTLYLPAAQFQMSATGVALRTTAPAAQLAELARDRIRRVDPDVQLVHVVPFSDMLERPLARPRFNAFVLSVFGSTALLLSMVGLYAVMASHVRQRRTEIAVRLALGATAGRVRNLVLAEVVRLSAIGTVVGLVGTALMSRVLHSMLYEVHPLDPLTLAAAAFVLMLGSAVAGMVPMRLATRANAAALLRGE